MSTHPHSDHDDLDSTDELPRLDVAAYEAQLATETNDTLASTDAWAVDGLRSAEGSTPREVAAARFSRRRTQPPEPLRTSDVTRDATRILGRIQQLEAELGAASERESKLQARCDRLAADFAAKEKDVRALSADNARLAEQRSLVSEHVRSLEQQLADGAARFEREIMQQRELRTAEQDAAATARLALERQLAELTMQAVQLRDENSRLDDDAQAATKLAKAQTELIEQFKQRLAAEEKSSAELARHLAAKIAEHANADHEIAQRDGVIRALTEARDDLATLLEERAREREALASQLEKLRARNKSMAREIFVRDNQIATLKADLAVHAETLAAIGQDVNRATAAAEDEHPDRILEPVGHDGGIIVLDKKVMTIGRTNDNDICIPSKLVSRNHARLLIGPNAVIIEDADSTNGCLVNDVPVKQQLMREGDVLAIGDLQYRLRSRTEDVTRSRDNVIHLSSTHSASP